MNLVAGKGIGADRDVITLRGVRARGLHGVLEQEKREGHEFLVDARLELDTPAGGRSDRLHRTVNYAEVAAAVVETLEAPGGGEPGVDLIETLAESIAGRVLAEQPLVRALEIEIHKPTAPIPHPFADVSIRIRRHAPAVDAVLALGSNLADRSALLETAAGRLAEADQIELDWRGPIIETDPVGGVDQGAFLNTAVGVRTTLGPWELLDLAHAIEQEAGRERTIRWGPRTLDVDVIIWGDLVQDDPDLTLPHPRAHERAFVLAPWAAARPAAFLPGQDGPRSVARLLEAAPDRDGVRPWSAPGSTGEPDTVQTRAARNTAGRNTTHPSTAQQGSER